MKRLLIFPIYFLIITFITSCGSSSHTTSDKGSISFNLALKRTTVVPRSLYLPANDICIDYGITTINAAVLNSSNATVTSVGWPCSAHEGTITGVPAGSNYTVRLEGIDSNSTVTWRGEKSGISISGGTTASAGTITMSYIGNDTTAPTITSSNPSDNATSVPVTILLTATFSEQPAVSSINATTFTVKIDTTPVTGSVTFDSNTKRAIFIPASNLSYSTIYTATVTTGVEDMAGNNMQSDYSWSFTTEAPPTSAPPAPTGVSATAGNSQVTITWDAVIGATSYNIYWSTTTGVTKTTGTQISDITSTSYVHTGLINGTTYYYVVTTVNSFGESSESSEVSATSGTTDTTPPTGSVIISDNASYTNSTSVTLTLPATDLSGVTQMCVSNTDTCTSWETYTTSKSWVLTSGDGTKTVYAWFKDAAGNISIMVSDSIILGSPPSALTGVTVIPGEGQATISWNAVSGATSYNIYWSTISGVTKTSGTKISGITSTSYTHTGLTNGTTYYYVVTAVNSNGESVESHQVLVIPPQVPISLPETGQTTCYDSLGSVIACAGTGQDGDLQKGVAWPTPRFTDNGNSTVIDNLTGLVWTKDGNAPGPAACAPGTTKTWQGALDYVTCLNSNSYLGYTDWRLPNVNELKSLVHAGQSDTSNWLNTQGFNNVQSVNYWSSTSFAYYSSYAWIVGMWNGGVYRNGKSANSYYVWPVRSGQSWPLGNSVISIPKTGQTTCYDSSGNVTACAGTGQDGDLERGVTWPNPRLTDNGDGTVTDNITSLMWTKDGNAPEPAVCSPATTKTWQEALDCVACLNTNNYLGYSDWHLPNINELRSLVHAGQSDTATWLNTQGFNNVQSVDYWSSTSSGTNYPDGAWIVGMWYGGMSSPGKSYVNGYVWPVRSGQ